MKAKSAAAKRFHHWLVNSGCQLCPDGAQVHHLRAGQGLSQRNHWLAIPLCKFHHDFRHAHPDQFKMQFGDELFLLGKMIERLFEEAR